MSTVRPCLRQGPLRIIDCIFFILSVNGKPFEGQAPSKGAALEAAAKKALDNIKAEHPGFVYDD